jgi:CheY-like chemotaxis protein
MPSRMNKKGEIIVVEDDPDDTEMICDAFKALEIPNKITCFSNARETLDHLRKVDADPFLILSDVRMPVINGFELKQMMYADENLLKKAVPFVLFSTTIDSFSFNTALLIGVQGYFIKPSSVKELQQTLRRINDYFQHCFGN